MTDVTPIDLVLPVFNPGMEWPSATLKYHGDLQHLLNHDVRLIVVDDGSIDQRPFDELKARMGAQMEGVKLPTNAGKGSALRAGMAKANAPLVLFTDADFPYTIESMVAVVACLKAGSDIALGHREQDYYASVPWFRKGLSEWFRFLLKNVLHFPISDTQCGLKGMNHKGKEVFLQTRIHRFLVDMEFIQRAIRQKNLQVTPVSVKLRKDVVFSKMGAGVLLREGINFLRILFG